MTMRTEGVITLPDFRVERHSPLSFDFQGRVTLRNDIPPLVTVSPLSLTLALVHFSPRRD
jgi:hypothetical protein